MSRYLERIHIDRYGALEDFDLGPFSSGLNVVYGPNEAGKSTVASFVGGVLFGWEEARGVRNTYRPADGGRSGSLAFSNDADPEDKLLVSREHNEDGLQGDSRVVSDLDHATYRTMFSLTSDELRSLRNTSDVTARLLTAGSGTGSSPASAFVEVEQRIASLTSKASDAGDSIIRLRADLQEKRDAIDAARELNELHKQQDRELAELAETRKTASKHLAKLDDEVKQLGALRARLESINEQESRRKDELSAARVERLGASTDAADSADLDSRLLELDAPEERKLRDKLDEYADERAKLTRTVDMAKENSAASTAAYEALAELDEGDMVQSPRLKGRGLQVAVSVLLPIAFVVGGIPLLFHGVQIRSLSFVALGAVLIVAAFFLAAAALVVLFRPNRAAETLEGRRQDAQWVMLQDRKKLEGSLAARNQLDDEVAAFLERNGLLSAQGSIRHAKSLLDEAHRVRSRLAAQKQRETAVEMRIAGIEEELAVLREQRVRILGEAELPASTTLRDLDALMADRTAQRDAVVEAHDEMNLRYGELVQLLDQARRDRSLDNLKFEYHELNCRMRESEHELVTLLLARRILEKSIAAWESRSQPEVYEEASRLFALVTEGAWTRVLMTAEGRLVAVRADGTVCEVRHLSVGTCQQLYLSLRVAMLLHAESVGRSIPVLADDIMVNFDEARRKAAARMLSELAVKRQVIVFTCHKATVDALRACGDITYLEL